MKQFLWRAFGTIYFKWEMSLCVSEAKCNDEQFNLYDLLIFIIVTLKCQIHLNWQLSLKLEAKLILIY